MGRVVERRPDAHERSALRRQPGWISRKRPCSLAFPRIPRSTIPFCTRRRPSYARKPFSISCACKAILRPYRNGWQGAANGWVAVDRQPAGENITVCSWTVWDAPDRSFADHVTTDVSRYQTITKKLKLRK